MHLRTTLLIATLSSTRLLAQQVPLSVLNPDCITGAFYDTPACLDAMHQSCTLNNLGMAAAALSYDWNEITFMCMPPATYMGGIPVSEVPECRQIQKAACHTAIQGYCNGTAASTTGLVQKGIDTELEVACVPSESTPVSTDDLKALDPGCFNPLMVNREGCETAAHKWCNSKGYIGSVYRKAVDDKIAVACATVGQVISAPVD